MPARSVRTLLIVRIAADNLTENRNPRLHTGDSEALRASKAEKTIEAYACAPRAVKRREQGSGGGGLGIGLRNKIFGPDSDEQRETVSQSSRCAIYARFSSEKQNALSIEQQVRKCREYAERHAMAVLEDHIYIDEAISGATEERPGLQRLLAVAKSQPQRIDVILVDDTSRLSRSIGDMDRITKELRFVGMKIAYVAHGFDSDSENAGILTAIYGGINEQYLVDLGKKTYRGVEQLALSGLHTGGRVFGYRRVPIESKDKFDSHGRQLSALS